MLIEKNKKTKWSEFEEHTDYSESYIEGPTAEVISDKDHDLYFLGFVFTYPNRMYFDKFRWSINIIVYLMIVYFLF